MKKAKVEKLIAAAMVEHEAKHKIDNVNALIKALRDYGIRVDILEPYTPEREE